jgi:hypothetical protein
MDDLEEAMAKLDKLRENAARAEEAWKEALREEHDWIRKILKNGPRGTQKMLVERGMYSRQHLDRIRRGKTSG